MMDSSSIHTPRDMYDVFLSFRGEETRFNFTSHLYQALCRKQIKTFIDNKLESGDEISDSLSKTIEESVISVIIFSKNYASSRWCLHELVKILECKKTYGRIVIPVFYGVDPSDVRNQTGNFGDAFVKHEAQSFKKDVLQRWRSALTEASNLSGWDSLVIRPESLLSEKIVEDVSKKLDELTPSHHNKNLIGVKSSIKKIEWLLSSGLKDVYTVGIWGSGGIGKTTVADAVYKKISNHFEGYCFIRNVREQSDKIGLTRLGQELLAAILEDVNLNIGGCTLKRERPERLCRKKVLIVLDDVTDFRQVELLIGGLVFDLGSRIIITSRDKQVLKNCGVDKDNLYRVDELHYDQALQLFSLYAFKQDHPIAGYTELSKKVLRYAKGVPLALKILASSLEGKSAKIWESALIDLEKSPDNKIQKVLQISYDGLGDKEKNLFLDIACFYKGYDYVHIMDVSNYSTDFGISLLIDKSLILIIDNKIEMHDLLQEMGKEIVRRESPKIPGKRSRLWCHEDIDRVLTKNTGTEAIEGILMDVSKVRKIHLNQRSFDNMHNLTLLKLYCPPCKESENKNKVHVSQDTRFPDQLRHLHFVGYPLKSLPSCLENLVELDMPYSNIKKLWNGGQDLVNLKRLNLRHSTRLVKSPDFSVAPNLESLTLHGCTHLRKVSSTICYLSKLVKLDLRYCTSLEGLPTFIHLESLKKLYLTDCYSLKELPQISSCIEDLFLNEFAIKELFKQVPPLLDLHNLECLNLDKCGMTKLPDSLAKLSSIQVLFLGRNKFESIPANIIELSNLIYLDVSFCDRLQSLPELPCNLLVIDANDCTSLKALSGLSVLFTCLQIVNFINCFELHRNEFEDIIEDVPRRIQDMASKRRAADKKKERSNVEDDTGCICFVGDDIAKWFSIQRIGYFITFQLLLKDPFNNYFVGFALCAVVEFEDCNEYGSDIFFVGYECRLKSIDGNYCHDWESTLFERETIQIIDVKSKHLVFLGYHFPASPFPDEFGDRYSTYDVFIQFYLHRENKDGHCEEYCNVIKCGVHVIYAHDFDESMTMEPNRT